jgi:hypothetical protein
VVEPSTAFGAPEGILEPSVRQAPDGHQEGGSHPTESSRSNRRILLAPALLMHEGKKTDDDLKKSVHHS